MRYSYEIVMSMDYTICHLTTVHQADDVRIFYRECLSLAKIRNYKVIICAPGKIPVESNVIHHKIANTLAFRPARVIMSQINALRVVGKIKADVWHIHDPELLPIAALLILLNRRIIWDAHEDYYRQFDSTINYRKYLPTLLRPFVKLTVKLFLDYIDRRAVGIIGATKSIAKKYKNNNVIVVGNEVVLTNFNSCQPNYKNKNILFIGQASSSQCYREVVKAISMIPDLKLIVACRNIDEIEMKYAFEMLQNRFSYLGWLNRKELAFAFSSSVVGLVTYENNPNHQDNRPNKFFEFCAAGLPIVATPTKFNINLIKDSGSGLISKDFRSRSLKLALEEIVSSEKVWSNCSEAGRKWVKKNGDWSISERSLLNLYSKVLFD